MKKLTSQKTRRLKKSCSLKGMTDTKKRFEDMTQVVSSRKCVSTRRVALER